MELIRRVHLMREISQEARGKGRKIALAPTMGALHDGHLSLVRRARELGDIVVVSIFVNPTQFGPEEDYARYPRDLGRDADLCIQEGVDYVFAPEPQDMYPDGFGTYVDVLELSAVLEGATRPGHFRGVCTVVLKLFNIVRPHFAVFGQKDAQQAVILKRMARDLNLDVELIVGVTVRNEDGLALSSRNAFLSPEERRAATKLFRALEEGRRLIESAGETRGPVVEATVRKALAGSKSLRVDYVAVVDSDKLAPVEQISGSTLIALAAWVGETRLIDNVTATPAAAAVGRSGPDLS
ncbi:MAG: pantoate--beta-alanine ligase [Acidobacteriota bacterium]|nr:MAG: pantoate--beta-alanine ligase [Acidobacteriota bacterium]